MASTDARSCSFVFNVRATGARILAAMLVAACVGALAFGPVTAQLECDRGWSNIGWDDATLTLRPVSVARSGRYYTEYSLGEIHKDERLLIDVGSRAFRPRIAVYQGDKEVLVTASDGNPASIRLTVPEDGPYVVVVSTDSPGEWGQFSWRHARCERGTEGGGVGDTGIVCDADWHRGKANYRRPVGEGVVWPGYQAVCSLGSCASAGSDDNGSTWPTGFRTYNAGTQLVEFFQERYDPRLDTVFECKDK